VPAMDLAAASVDELFALARSAQDEEAYADVVEELRKRPEERTFKIASVLCDSFAPGERGLGVDVLAHLGVEPGTDAGDGPYAEQATNVLLRLLEEDDDPGVLQAAAFGLSHIHDPRAIQPLVALSAHPAAEVRYSVVHGLLGHDEDRAVAALIRLSNDADDEVRNWATFALGVQIDRDTPELSEALAARLDDPHEETRAEAIRGLARRRDERALEPALAAVADGGGASVDEAIVLLGASTGDPRLRPHLERLRDDPAAAELYGAELERALERSGSGAA
jgi:HEAT repeat protein